jgi:pimeloyl-ACP methyl ester carboxylesterase
MDMAPIIPDKISSGKKPARGRGNGGNQEGDKMTNRKAVFIPGLLNDGRLWDAQIKALADIVDGRAADITGADSMAGLAESVLKAAPEKFILIGLSMGGYTALEIMRRAPERVLGLALFDTSARPDTPEAADNRRRLMALADKDFDAVIQTLMPKWVTAEGLINPGLTSLMRDMARKAGKETFQRQQNANIGRLDSRPFLKDIRCPTLVAFGSKDVITPYPVHEELAASIPGAHLKIIPDAGHLSPLEKPEPVTALLAEWIPNVSI